MIDLIPYPLTPLFFAERLRGVDEKASADMFKRLQGINVLDDSGFCVWHKCENCWCANQACGAPCDAQPMCYRGLLLASVLQRAICHVLEGLVSMRTMRCNNAGSREMVPCRDPMYAELKRTLWDLCPAWEDQHCDAAFKEMLWASEAGAPRRPPCAHAVPRTCAQRACLAALLCHCDVPEQACRTARQPHAVSPPGPGVYVMRCAGAKGPQPKDGDPEHCRLMRMAQCMRRPRSTLPRSWTSSSHTLQKATSLWGPTTPRWLAALSPRTTAAPPTCTRTSPAAGVSAG